MTHLAAAGLLLVLATLAVIGGWGRSAVANDNNGASNSGTPAAASSLLYAADGLSLTPPPVVPVPGRLAGRSICLDPGHDREYAPGAVARDAAGMTLFSEQDISLAVAYKLKSLLEAEGAEVCVTRDVEGALAIQPYDFNGNGIVKGFLDAPERTQPRIDYMNAFGAELVLSIHFNGFGDASASGAEAYYSDSGRYNDSNRGFAQAVLDALVDEIAANGYQPVKRGIHSDRYKTEYRAYTAAYGFPESCAECLRLFTLGNNPMSAQRGLWHAGALVEVLFLTNPRDVAFLARPDALDVIARGLAQGVLRYVELMP